MAKSAIEKAIEEQRREAKKIAELQALRDRANIIVSGQPLVGGMRMMDKAAEEILQIVLSHFDGNTERAVQGNYDIIPSAYKMSLPLEFEKLKMYGMVSGSAVWIGGMWEATLSPQGVTYFTDKKRAMEKEEAEKEKQYTIGSIIATASNFVLGDMINSALSVDNSTSRIEQEIQEKGAEDQEELLNLLAEVKELIENMQDSRHIPKNKGLFSKLSKHLEKHGWFYGEVVGLIGSAVMQMLPI